MTLLTYLSIVTNRTLVNQVREGALQPALQADRFQALDACHQQIHLHLGKLATVLKYIETDADRVQYRQLADEVESFFSNTSRQHHLAEEKNVFPGLLTSDSAEVVQAVRLLKQDHIWIEQNWLALVPMLRAIAEGDGWVDMEEMQHAVQVFLALCNDHMVLEETLIYPAAKTQLAQQLAQREQS
jgi:hemerythrin-like domain-containing protein